MASSVSSVSLVPVNAAVSRPAAFRPAEAGVPAAFDPQTARQSQGAIPLGQEARARESEKKASGAGQDARPDSVASSAPFLAQLLSQDQADPRPPNPADAARAYRRFQDEPLSGFVLDAPERIDVKV